MAIIDPKNFLSFNAYAETIKFPEMNEMVKQILSEQNKVIDQHINGEMFNIMSTPTASTMSTSSNASSSSATTVKDILTATEMLMDQYPDFKYPDPEKGSIKVGYTGLETLSLKDLETMPSIPSILYAMEINGHRFTITLPEHINFISLFRFMHIVFNLTTSICVKYRYDGDYGPNNLTCKSKKYTTDFLNAKYSWPEVDPLYILYIRDNLPNTTKIISPAKGDYIIERGKR